MGGVGLQSIDHVWSLGAGLDVCERCLANIRTVLSPTCPGYVDLNDITNRSRFLAAAFQRGFAEGTSQEAQRGLRANGR